MRETRRLFSFLLLFSLALFLPPAAAAAAPTAGEKKRLEGAEERRRQLESEKQRTRDMIDRLDGMKSDVSAYIGQIDRDMAEIEAEISGLEEQIGEKEREIGEKNAALSAAQADADRQYADMKLRIRYMYERGDTGFLELLLSSADLSEFFNRAEYVRKISEYDRAQLELYAASCDALREGRERLEEEKESLLSLRGGAEAKREAAKTLMEEKLRELERYSAGIREAKGELSAYQEQIEAQEAEIRAVEEEVRRREEEERKRTERGAENAQGSAAGTKSLGELRFLWPCPSSAMISSPFGARSSPAEGASSYHRGIDIAAPSGSAIVAAADGEVVTAAYSGAAGNFIMLSHGGGIYTLYMHCSGMSVGVGQRVRAGDMIGKVGSTGISTGPHLHFGLRSGGSYLNPSDYVSP